MDLASSPVGELYVSDGKLIAAANEIHLLQGLEVGIKLLRMLILSEFESERGVAKYERRYVEYKDRPLLELCEN